MSYFAYAGPEIEDDYVLWVERQIELIREKQFAQVDLENLLGELESIVLKDKRQLRSRIRVIVAHLLKCEYQPRFKTKSWLDTLSEQREKIEDLLEESPSLSRLVTPYAQSAYPRAVAKAARETRLPKSTFPTELPYTVSQVLDQDFIP